jgi:hypothetical protein
MNTARIRRGTRLPRSATVHLGAGSATPIQRSSAEPLSSDAWLINLDAYHRRRVALTSKRRAASVPAAARP